MDTILNIVNTINSYLSDYILIVLLLSTGIFFTIKTRFVQVRCFGEGMKRIFGGISLNGKSSKDGLSSFQALTTAIAAQVGTGNIIGACGAILTGGPGAIFWMWVIAFFGMATIYAEAVLAQETRVVAKNGEIFGGPVYYIKKAFKGKLGIFLAGFFAFAIVMALGFMGCMVQSNSIAQTSNNAFGVPTLAVGVVVSIICAFVFLGDVDRLASVTEKVVPIMAVLYLGGCVVILAFNIKDLPEAFFLIFKYAFNPSAIIGGGFGAALKTAISQGAQRGLFSNEAGMGATPHAHALADVEKPHNQGVVAMAGTFIDTFVVLSITALVVISSFYAGNGVLADGVENGVNKTNMAQIGFNEVMGGNVGAIFIAVCLFFFAFSTILSWNFFGKINVTYLFGKSACIVYTIISIGFVFLGSVFSDGLVWALTDMFNYLMVFPNVLALIALSKIVKESSNSNKLK